MMRVRKQLEGMLWLVAFGSLILAAQTWASGTLLSLIAIVWAAAVVTVVPLHFYKAWRKLGSVPNRREYVLWVGLETLFAVGVVGVFLIGAY